MTESRLDTLRRMAQAKPDDPRLLFGLAVELLKQGETRGGADTLRSYLAMVEDEGNGWARLGAALAELGEVEDAKLAYRRGIEIASRRGHGGLLEEMEEALEDLG